MKAIRIGKYNYAVYMYINREKVYCTSSRRMAQNNNAVNQLTKLSLM